MASDRIHQNAQNGGTKKDKNKRKPESQGGVSFEELLRQEKGDRDQAAKRYNAQSGGKHTSSAYSPKKKQSSGGGGKKKSTPKSAPTPTPRPDPTTTASPGLAGPIDQFPPDLAVSPNVMDPNSPAGPGGDRGAAPPAPMVPLPARGALEGIPPEYINSAVGMPQQLNGLPPELGGAGNAFNPNMPVPPMPQLPPGLPPELGGIGNPRDMLAKLSRASKPGGGPYGYGGTLF